jgi:predicted phosphodiesterase
MRESGNKKNRSFKKGKEVIGVKKWTRKEIDYLVNNPPLKDGDYQKLANKFNRTAGSVRWKCRTLKLKNVRDNSQAKRNNQTLADRIYEYLAHTRKKYTVEELCDVFNEPPRRVRNAFYDLKSRNILVNAVDEKIVLEREIPPTTNDVKIPLEIYDHRWVKFGIVSDTHLNSKYQRLDVLDSIYDIAESEGVKDMFHAGNIIDGYGRLNQYDVFNVGTEDQIQYLIDKYPQRKGITTHFITADDHEGWIIQREHINIGKSINLEAKEMGRNDLHFLGHVEADVLFDVGTKPTRMRLFHPGGGTSYALSYKPQKIVESLQGGEKPDILVVGHFHKLGFFNWRNVSVILAGCVEDQTPFMRKKHIAAHIGFYIVSMNIAPDGSVNRIIPEEVKFYDKRYYSLNGWKKTPDEFERPVNWFYKW